MKVPRDPPDGMLQHIADVGGLQMSKAREDKLVPLLVPGAVQSDRVQMRVEAQIGRAPDVLYSFRRGRGSSLLDWRFRGESDRVVTRPKPAGGQSPTL